MSKVKVRIPCLVDRNGKVAASEYTTSEGESTTDIGLLYEHWWDEPEGIELKLVYVEAELDLGRLFAGHDVTGEVRYGQDND